MGCCPLEPRLVARRDARRALSEGSLQIRKQERVWLLFLIAEQRPFGELFLDGHAFILINRAIRTFHIAAISRAGGDQLTDDDILLQTVERILIALHRGVRQNLYV